MSHLQCLGEEVTLLDVVFRRVDLVNIVKSRESTGDPAMFLQRLNRFPTPLAILRILCQPPHHEVRLERLRRERERALSFIIRDINYAEFIAEKREKIKKNDKL